MVNAIQAEIRRDSNSYINHIVTTKKITELEVQSNSLRSIDLYQLSLNAKKYVVKSLVSREVDHLQNNCTFHKWFQFFWHTFSYWQCEKPWKVSP